MSGVDHCLYSLVAPAQYLAYTPVDSVPLEARRSLAVDIAIAALIGEGVFNFGEIIEHPILASLEGTPSAWLADLMKVFHTGDINAFSLVLSANQVAYSAVVSAHCMTLCPPRPTCCDVGPMLSAHE